MRDLLLSLFQRVLRFRYAKFGIVGAGGTGVNMLVLYLAQEFVFRSIAAPRERLYVSLALAILVATLNNFTWNRIWTWADRRLPDPTATTPGVWGLFGRYALASWLGIALQYGLTLWFANVMHYLIANVLAIAVASVSNFLANDRWTFRVKK
jgi:putative flippase GtrA